MIDKLLDKLKPKKQDIEMISIADRRFRDRITGNPVIAGKQVTVPKIPNGQSSPFHTK